MYPVRSTSPAKWFVPPLMALPSSPSDPDILGVPPASPAAHGQLGHRDAALPVPGQSRDLRAARLRLAAAEQAVSQERARFPGPVVQGEPTFSIAQELATERVAYARLLLSHSETIEATVRAPLQAHLPAVLVNIVLDYLDLDAGRSCAAGRCVSRTQEDA